MIVPELVIYFGERSELSMTLIFLLIAHKSPSLLRRQHDTSFDESLHTSMI